MNIIFDFGRVVFTWNPLPLVENHFNSPETILQVNQAVFEHPDWLEIDRGALTFEELAEHAAARTGEPYNRLLEMIRHAPEILQPIPETIDLLPRLKQNKHRLFALSNMGKLAMAYLDRTHPFLALFDGKVISSEINLVKPDPAIFQYLINRFKTDPADSVFIDDHGPNIHTAAALGFHTIQFTSPQNCEMALINLGCL